MYNNSIHTENNNCPLYSETQKREYKEYKELLDPSHPLHYSNNYTMNQIGLQFNSTGTNNNFTSSQPTGGVKSVSNLANIPHNNCDNFLKKEEESEYNDYLQSIENNEEINNDYNLGEGGLLNLKEEDDFCYRNGNMFNFEDYFTV